MDDQDVCQNLKARAPSFHRVLASASVYKKQLLKTSFSHSPMSGLITSRKAWLSVEWIRGSMSWFSVKPFSLISILLQEQTESDGLSPNQWLVPVLCCDGRCPRLIFTHFCV